MTNYPVWDGVPACSGTDTESWFTPDKSAMYKEIGLLRRICGGCEVRVQCLDYALKHDVHGYWGNTTPRERQRLRGKLGIKCEPIYDAREML